MTVATQPAPTRAPVPVLPPPVRSRFTPLVAGSPRLTGWLGPIGIGLLALAMRVWNLGYPRSVLFDETYYAKDAYALTQFGYVQDYKESANGDILDGILTGLWTGEPTQVVHPDGGKWMIAIGEQIFGMTPFGWRISAAVVGALMVVVVARLVRRLTGSTLLGCVAGLLLCFDGMHFVMSRLALLDIFLAFWLLCAVACLVTDRDWGRVRLVAAEQPVGRWGPLLLVRPWRLAAGVCFGMACGTKWNALWFIAVFGLLTYAWDTGARRAIGVRAAWLKSALVDGLPAFLSIVGVAFVVYLLTWTGWLLHHDVYEQRFAFGYGDDPPWGSYLDTPATTWFGQSVEALRSLWHYHLMVFDFHTGDYLEGKTHPYGSQPQGWLLLSRPVGVEAQNDLPPSTAGCTAAADSTCLRQVLILGNPVLWWSGAAALGISVWTWVRRRDWRFGVPVLAVAAGWLPWFLYDDRPIFLFYAIAFIPFTVVAVTLVIGRFLGDHTTGGRRWRVGAVAAYSVAVIACFAFFYPIYSDQLITHDQWTLRMWFSRWV